VGWVTRDIDGPGVPGPGDGRPSGTCGRACPAAFCSARASKA